MYQFRFVIFFVLFSFSFSFSACSAARLEQLNAAMNLAQEQISHSQEAANYAAINDGQNRSISAAKEVFHGHLSGLDTDPLSLKRRAFARALSMEDPELAQAIFVSDPQFAPQSMEAVTAQVEIALLGGQITEAQTLAWAAAENLETEEKAEAIRLWYRTLAEDPAFYQATPRTIVAGEDVEQIQHLDRGTSLIFKFRNDGSTTHAFKPEQTLHLTSIRGELASWRLCRVIHCNLKLPLTEEIRVSEADFLALTGLASIDETQTAFVREHSDLVWHTDENNQRWLYGVIKAWIPGFVRYPIETVSLWEPLLRTGRSERSLRATTFAEIIEPILLTDPERHPMIRRHGRGIDGFEFAEQISDLHVFDLLTNNWDRYRTAAPGANCQWDSGQFVSIDNGATFQRNAEEHSFTAVRYRVNRVKVFSRTTINAIRWMDTETLFPILFSESPFGSENQERFEYFLERREWLLNYVDELIEEYGEDRVLVFQ